MRLLHRGVDGESRRAWWFVCCLAFFLGHGVVVLRGEPVERDYPNEILGPWRLVLSLDVFGLVHPASDLDESPTYWVYGADKTLKRISLSRGTTEPGRRRVVERSYEVDRKGQMRDWGDPKVREPRQVEIREDVLISRHVTGGVMFFRRVSRVPESLADRDALDEQRDLLKNFKWEGCFDPERFARLTLSRIEAGKSDARPAPEWAEMRPSGERMHPHKADEAALLPAWVETDGIKMREWTMPARQGDEALVSVNVTSITLIDAHRIAWGQGYRLLSCVETPNPERKARRYSAVWVPETAKERFATELERLGLTTASLEIPPEMRW